MKDKNFKLTIEILKKNRINYWICHGTLLGIIRDDQLLPWDNDIDIGILENITNKDKIISKFLDEGFKKKDKFFDDDGLVTFVKDGGKEVDLNFYNFLISGIPNDKSILYINWYVPKNRLMKLIFALSQAGTFNGKYKKVINLLGYFKFFFDKFLKILIKKKMFYKKAGYQHPYYFVNDLKTIIFQGISVNIPCKEYEYLSFIYGESWKITKKNFNWEKDSPATKVYKN
jgi:hypothetical protein